MFLGVPPHLPDTGSVSVARGPWVSAGVRVFAMPPSGTGHCTWTAVLLPVTCWGPVS